MSSGFLPTQEELPKQQPPQPEAAPVIVEEESSVEADEKTLEQIQEQEAKETFLETPSEEAPVTEIQAPAEEGAPAVVAAVVVQKDEVMVQVEKILEEEMGPYFETLPDEAKERFKKKGEEVAGQISVMVRTFRVKVKVILHLIRNWFLTIPGVNKFFMEQEAKIKTDKILEYSAQLKEESKNKI